MPNILVISSTIHSELAAEQRDFCLSLVKKAGLRYQVELLQAGTYEIPFVINAYHQKKSFDGYIALGLVLEAFPVHSAHIMTHIRHCFTQFALNQIIVGNGIVCGATMEELREKVRSDNPCLSAYPSAVNAVDCLIQLRNRIAAL